MKVKSLCFSERYFNRWYIFLSALALFSGGIIYILLRTSESVFFRWIHVTGFDRWINVAREKSLSLNPHPSEWIVFSLPNGLWAFSYALLITGIWSGNKSWIRHIWMASILMLVPGYEILQYPGILPGTFCMQDIALGTAGLIIGIITGTKTNKSNHHEKAFE